jgi:hypothetical protein
LIRWAGVSRRAPWWSDLRHYVRVKRMVPCWGCVVGSKGIKSPSPGSAICPQPRKRVVCTPHGAAWRRVSQTRKVVDFICINRIYQRQNVCRVC